MNKKVKTVDEAVKEVIEGKKQNIHVTFTHEAQLAARIAIQERGLPMRDGWDGPLFEDVAGYQLNGDWLCVSLKDGTSYIYPASDIARIKHYNV